MAKQVSRCCSHSYCTNYTTDPSGRCAGHPLANDRREATIRDHWGRDPEGLVCREGCPACAAIAKAEGREP